LRHEGEVLSAAFSPSGERVLTTTNLTDARIWRVSHDPLGAKIRDLTSFCLSPAFREKPLGEDRRAAEESHLRCGRCLEAFGERAPGGTI
jgi:hypothetical protein